MALSFVLLCSQWPITSALKFGDDEGIALIKGLLRGKDYILDTQMWDDQPPVLTILLDVAFRFFGSTLPVGRLMAAAVDHLLLCSLFPIVRIRDNLCLLAVFFLISS
jgi:hypothetical protein